MSTTDLEKQSLEAHVDLCAERYGQMKLELENIPEFIEFFGDIGSNSYHPNEIAAEIISKDVFNDLNSDVTSKPCYINYKKWWNNIN